MTSARQQERATDGSPDQDDRSHLDGVEDGCGCAEVWEHLSDERSSAD
jgi:hypothetical protein